MFGSIKGHKKSDIIPNVNKRIKPLLNKWKMDN